MLQLFEAGKGAEAEQLFGELDALEEVPELEGAAPQVPAALEAGQLPRRLVEAHAVTALVGIGGAEGDIASFEHVSQAHRDVADLVVGRGAPDVEDFVVDGVSRRLEGG